MANPLNARANRELVTHKRVLRMRYHSEIKLRRGRHPSLIVLATVFINATS